MELMERSTAPTGTERRPFLFITFAALASLFLLPSGAFASDPARICKARKLAATAKLVKTLLLCESVAAASGGAPDPDCAISAISKFAASFLRAERSGECPTMGDAISVDAETTAF